MLLAGVCYSFSSASDCLAASSCELSPFTSACQPAAGGSLATLAGGPTLAAQVRTTLCGAAAQCLAPACAWTCPGLMC